MPGNIDLGTLSVALTANLRNFSSNIAKAIKELEGLKTLINSITKKAPTLFLDTSKSIRNISALKSELTSFSKMAPAVGGVTLKPNEKFYKTEEEMMADIARMRAENTAKGVEQGYSFIKTNEGVIASFGRYKGQIGKVKEETAELGQATQAAIKPIVAFGGTQAEAQQQMNKVLREMGLLKNASVKLGTTFQPLQDGTWRAVTSISKGTGSILKQIFSLENWIGKIIHYITFSIGVQLVMTLKRGFQSIIQDFSEFQKNITNAVAVLGYVGSGFDKVRDKISKLAVELTKGTVYSAKDAAVAFYDLASAGYDLTKVGKKELLPILNYATATQSDLKDATETLMTVMKSFSMDLKDTAKIADIFTAAINSSFLTAEKLKNAMKYVGPVAGELGISLADTTAALATLTDRGLEGGQAGQRLTMILTQLLDPSEKSQDTLERLGLTLDDLNPEVYSLSEILFKLQGASFGATEAAEMFRARTAAAALVLVNNADAVYQMSMALENARDVTTQVAEAQKETLWASLQMTKNEITALSIEVGEKLAPTISAVAEVGKRFLTPVLNAIGVAADFVSKHLGAFKVILTILLSLLAVWIVKTRLIPPLLRLVGASVQFVRNLYASLVVVKGALISVTFKEIAANARYLASLLATSGGVWTLKAGITALTAAMLANPITWFAIAIGIAAAAIFFFNRKTEETVSGIDSVTNSIILQNKSLSELEKTYLRIGTVPPTPTLSKEIKRGKYFGELLYTLASNSELYKEELQKLQKILGINDKQLANLINTAKQSVEESTDLASSVIYYNKIVQGTWKTIEEFRDALMDATKEERESFETKFKLTRVFASLTGNIYAYHKNLSLAKETILEADEAAEKLHNALENNYSDTELIINLTEDYINKREKATKAEGKYFGALHSIIKEIRAYKDETNKSGSTLDEWIGLVEDTINLETQYDIKQKESIRLVNERQEAVENLSSVILQYGHDSREAITAQDRLNAVIRDQIDLEQELIKTDSDIIHNKKLISAVIGNTVEDDKKLSGTERELLGIVFELKELERDYVKTKGEMLTLDAKKQVLDNIRIKGTTLIEEKARIFLETEQKIFDLEEKLYKLRADQVKQGEDLFEDLAEQGLISQDVVDAYKDMEKAQGRVMKLNYAFTRAYDELTPQQQELVNAFLNTREGTDEYNKALLDLKKAGIANIDLFIEYNNALDDLADATKNYQDVVLPLVDNLREVGVISSETATTYYDIIDNANEAATANYDLLDAYKKVMNTMRGYIDMTVSLAESLAGEGQGIADVYDQLLVKMGIFESEGEASGGMLSWLNNIFQTSNSSIIDFKDSQLILAATMTSLLKTIGLYEDGMTLTDMANKLNIKSIDDLSNMVSASMADWKSYGDVISELSNASTIFADAASKLSEALSKLSAYAAYASSDLRELALQFDFASLLSQAFDGDVDALLTDLAGKKLSFDFSFTSEWDGEDWDAWAGGLGDKSKEIIDIINKVTGLDIDTSWSGKDWDSHKSTLMDHINEINNIFKGYTGFINFDAKWDKLDWSSFVSKVMSNTGTLKSDIEALATELGLTINWDKQGSFEKFVQNLSAEQLQEFIRIVKANGAELPVGVDEQEFITFQTLLAGYEWPTFTIEFNVDTSQWDIVRTTIPDDAANIGDKAGQSFYDGFIGWMIKLIAEIRSILGAVGDIGKGIFNTLFGWTGFTLARGGIIGLQKGIAETKGPQLAMIGEAGPEAVIPLAGANKKYGEKLLKEIIPRYFPDLSYMQAGGITDRGVEIRQGGRAINIRVDATLFNETVNNFITGLRELMDTSSNKIIDAYNQFYSRIRDAAYELFNKVIGSSSDFNTNISQASTLFYTNIVNAATIFKRAVEDVTPIIVKHTYEQAKATTTAPITTVRNVTPTVNVTTEVSGIGKAIVDSLGRSKPFAQSIGDYITKQITGSTPTHERGGIYHKPTYGVFGEAGAEALIPLEGANKKYGLKLLREIISGYYPQLEFQYGGVFGRYVPISSIENNAENYNILGPVYVQAENVEEVAKSLKYRYRVSR